MATKQPIKPLTAAQFNKLPRATRAVMLAEDVLAQIAAKKINVCTDYYLKVDIKDRDLICSLARDSEANKPEIFKVIQNKCTVCAKGALFLSSVYKTNNSTVGETLHSEERDITKRLSNEFSEKTLHLIEAAFEQSMNISSITDYIYRDGPEEEDKRYKEFEKASMWAPNWEDNGYPNGEAFRLAAIMLNVVKNKGEFKVSQKCPDYFKVEKALKKYAPVVVEVN